MLSLLAVLTLPTWRAEIVEGVRTVASPGIPGPVAVFGPNAQPIIVGSAGSNVQAAVVAVAEKGRSRFVALGHEVEAPERALAIPVLVVIDPDDVTIDAEADALLAEQHPLAPSASAAIAVPVPVARLSECIAREHASEHQRKRQRTHSPPVHRNLPKGRKTAPPQRAKQSCCFAARRWPLPVQLLILA